jgi:probable rRNA maturation factor
MVIIQNKQAISIDIAWLQKAATIIVTFLGYKDFDLAIQLVTNHDMQAYNKQFRSVDKPTDVLSFPFFTDIQPGERLKPSCADEYVLGDIIMAPLYIQDTLEQWNDTFEHCLLVLLVHSICHLLGYDHIDDADFALMDAEEKRIVTYLEKAMI